MKLLTKLILFFIPLTFLVVTGVILVSKKQVHDALIEEVGERGLAFAQNTSRELGQAPGLEHEAVILPPLQDLKARTDAVYVEAIDGDGRVLAHTNVTEANSVYRDKATLKALNSDAPTFKEVTMEDKPVLNVTIPILKTMGGEIDEDFLLSAGQSSSSKRVGTLRLGLPVAETLRVENTIFFSQARLLVMATTILSLGLMFFLFRSVLRPARRLVSGISRISEGQFGETIPVTSKDEMGRLTECFNQMNRALATTTVSKDYMDAIMQHMLDPLLIIRPDGAIRSLNDAACRLLGYSNTDLLNKPVDVLFSGEKNPLQEKGLKRILSGESVRDVELLFLGKNKESIPVLFSASLFKDKENQVVGVICGARDLTERKKLETRMLQSEKLSAVGQLAAGVAHEINNPLGIILGFSQSLTRRIEAGNVFEAPLKSIEREAIRCKTLVQDLLTFSRVTISDREPMDMNSAIEGALSLVKARAKIKQVDIRQELSPSIPKVFGNRGKIQQVIINLCNNAIDAMGNGGILTIETCSMEGFPLSWVCLKVTDNGSGIPHNLISRIFDPFFTTKPVGQGTGLGLSLVHEIVKSHSGLLDVISEPGHTVFTVKFPIKSPAEMEARMVAERLKEEKIMPSPRGGNRP